MRKNQRIELFRTPFMEGWLEIIGEDVYPKIRTQKAAVILPYSIEEDGACNVVLLRQPRPEIGETMLKTVGGYCRDNESQEMCAKRNLLDKLGIDTDELRSIGPVLGYSVAEIPIECYLTDSWLVVKETPAGHERVVMPLMEALSLARRGLVMDDSSSIPIMQLALQIAGF